MKIKVFNHAMDWFGHTILAEEYVNLLEKTGLLDASDEMYMMLHFNEDSFNWLKQRWLDRSNVKYVVFDETYKNWCEATTMLYIQELCHSTNEDFYVLYLSHKGVTHQLDDEGQMNWRRYMNYWNVEKWKECVQKLDEGYDTCGASWLAHEPYSPFYAGNVFWAKSSYLRKCKRLVPPPEVNYQSQIGTPYHHRYDLEYWHGTGNPKWYDMHPGKYIGEKDFRWAWPPEKYRI